MMNDEPKSSSLIVPRSSFRMRLAERQVRILALARRCYRVVKDQSYRPNKLDATNPHRGSPRTCFLGRVGKYPVSGRTRDKYRKNIGGESRVSCWKKAE